MKIFLLWAFCGWVAGNSQSNQFGGDGWNGVASVTASELQCSDLKLWGHTCSEPETACDKSMPDGWHSVTSLSATAWLNGGSVPRAAASSFEKRTFRYT